MDRETRKANLKKLQLPGSSGNKQQRKTRQTDKPTTTNTAITKYFQTPNKQNQNLEELTNVVDTGSEHTQTKHSRPPDENASTAPPRSRAKRTKLDAFIFKDPSNMPSSIKKVKKSLNDEDLTVPEGIIKKAPKLSQSKRKACKTVKARKQTVIKTAFLRNEQLFAEIAAQHCAADQFDGDDVQLALAISKSEAENMGLQIVDDNMEDVGKDAVNTGEEVETIREKLKMYGFRTAEKKDYNTFAAAFLPKTNNRRLKSKWANKFTALTLRSSEIQLKKLQENTERLLKSQYCTNILKEHDQALPLYKLQSSLLRKSRVHEHKKILQNADNLNRPHERFFVTELFEINQVSAGHLLKDWCAIQGRDLTPNTRDKQNMERVEMLKNLYQDLEEYFSSRKRLDWTSSPAITEDHEIASSKEVSQDNGSAAKENTPRSTSLAVVEKVANEELNGLIELIENSPRNDKCPNENEQLSGMIERRENIQRTKEIVNQTNNSSLSFYDKKILQLLPASKSLDTMHVSSCSINTQATINTTQKNRSNSPDLFADSDVEDVQIETDKTEETVKESKDKESSSEDLKTGITTYEFFSSDEVKKTSLLEPNKCEDKESLPSNSFIYQDIGVIDLTQEDSQLNNTATVNYLNESKPVVEIDLFADSPLQEENSDPADSNGNTPQLKCTQIDKEEELKFTLSSEASYKEQHILEKKTEDSFVLSPKAKATLEKLEEEHKQEEEEDVAVLREIVMDQTDLSFCNFEGIKQLGSSFHKNTATMQNDIINYNLSGNDTLFQQLCNKYLNQESTKEPSARGKVTKGVARYSSAIIQTLKTPLQCDNSVHTAMDYDVANSDNDGPRKRKSPSFTIKTPTKLDSKKPEERLTKSQSFTNLNSNISLDLTLNDDGEEEEQDQDQGQDDDCLVLSDDEINYSIWQADKTVNLQTSQEKDCEENNTSLTSNISSSEEDSKTFDKENVIEFSFSKENANEFSYLDLEEKEKSLIKISLGPEETLRDFGILTSKYAPSSNSVGQKEMKFDRSEFGILEEYSEPIDGYTPNLCTPTKVLAEASFLSSPTENKAPMKPSKKFHDLVMDVPATPPLSNFPEFEDFSDFDDFDMLLSTSPLKSKNSAKKPLGIDQLLTAEISFQQNPREMTPPAAKNLSTEFQEVKYNNKTYNVRYTNSPKPDYTTYTEAELLKLLYNYGIKPLKRKQAVKMLEYIYNQTHPIITDEPQDDIEDTGDKYQEDVITLDDFELPGTSKSKEALKSCKSLTKSGEISTTMFFSNSENKMASKATVILGKTMDLQDSCGVDILRYSSGLEAELPDENYILQTNVTKKTPQPLLPLHIAWHNLVCSNIKLHEIILMYEPIDLQEIYLFLKSLGYRYDPKDLKTFFDRRCIIFRYDIAGAAAAGNNNKLKHSNRDVRKSKQF